MLANTEMYSQIVDFLMSARAEIFLFVVAILAHLLLFGNVFPRRAVYAQKKILDPEDDAPEKQPNRSSRRSTSPIPENMNECETCLNTAFEDGDYQRVLRCWGQLKKIDEAPSVHLGQVVEAMQRFKKDSNLILNELRQFFKKHHDTCDISAVNELLESISKSLDTELSQQIVNMVQQIGLEPDSRTYEILLAGYFSARDFHGVHATYAEMMRREMPLSVRANAVLLKTALRMNNLTESLHRFREIRRLGEGLLEGQAASFFSQILDLVCREHQLHLLANDLESLPLSGESVHKILAECISSHDLEMMGKVERLARSQGVKFTDKTYQLLMKAAGTDHSRVMKLFDEIVGQKVEVSSEVASAVLATCGSKDTTLADRLLEHIKPSQMPVICALIRYYSENGFHDKACDVYERHVQEQVSKSMGRSLLDARTERTLMHSLTKSGRESMAKGLLDAAPANVAKHIAMIRDCATKKNLEGAISVFNTLKSSGAELSRSMYNAVLDACVECGDLRRADEWMQQMKTKQVTDVISYNTMVKALVRSQNFSKARTLMTEMTKEGLAPNQVTYNELINGMVQSATARKSEVWSIVDEMKAQGHTPNRVTCSILLKDLKAKSPVSDVSRTMDLVTDMTEPMDEVLLSSVVEACVRVGKPDLLTTKLAQLTKNHKVVINGAHTFGSLIKAYGHAKDVDSAWRCWKEMRTRHITPTSITIGCMVEAVASNGDPEGAYELIKQMQEDDLCRDQVNAVVYCSVLKSFAQTKKMERVWNVWEDMIQSQVVPSITTYNALIDACARNSPINAGMDRITQLLADMKQRGLKPNLITYSTVLKGHSLRGDVRAAFEVLNEMRTQTNLKPDEIMYNTLLDGCAQASLVEEGLRLLKRMQDEDIRPSNYTLSILVKLLGNGKQLDRAFELVDQLAKKYHFKPNAPVYGNLIQACLTNRDLPKALSVLERMGHEKLSPDMRTISSVIRSCISQGLLENATLVLRGALGIPCTASYPAANDTRALKGLEDLASEVLNTLAVRRRVKDLAAPMLSDIRLHKPKFRIESSIQQRIATGL